MRLPNLIKLNWHFNELITSEERQLITKYLPTLFSEKNFNEYYRVGNRCILKTYCPSLGPVAIKSSLHTRIRARIWYKYIKTPPIKNEFLVMKQFLKIGGHAPKLFAIGYDQNNHFFYGGYILMLWLKNVKTASEYIQSSKGNPQDTFWESMAQAVYDAAQIGLVHGGHSPHNLMVESIQNGFKFFTIDFEYSRMYKKFNFNGFVHDVHRIGRRLIIERTCSVESVRKWFDIIIKIANLNNDEKNLWTSAIQGNFNKYMIKIGKPLEYFENH